MNKSLLFASSVLLTLLINTAAAEDRDHRAGAPEIRPDAKIFRWGENQAGDCHQIGAVLVIRPNGTATFDSDIWSRTHGTDVWHSTIHLRGPEGELGNSGNHDSPGIPRNKDGPGNKVHQHFDFTFPAGNFFHVIEAVEHSSC